MAVKELEDFLRAPLDTAGFMVDGGSLPVNAQKDFVQKVLGRGLSMDGTETGFVINLGKTVNDATGNNLAVKINTDLDLAGLSPDVARFEGGGASRVIVLDLWEDSKGPRAFLI